MDWLSTLIARLLNLFKLNPETQAFDSVHFFIYDTIKIIILLFVMVFIISLIQSYFFARKKQNHSGSLFRNRRKLLGGSSRHPDSVLFLLVHPDFYRLHGSRHAAGHHVFVFDYLADG